MSSWPEALHEEAVYAWHCIQEPQTAIVRDRLDCACFRLEFVDVPGRILSVDDGIQSHRRRHVWGCTQHLHNVSGCMLSIFQLAQKWR